MDVVFTIGIFTSLFFFILLLNKKNKSVADSILSIWMFVISIHLFSTYFYIEGYWEVFPHLIGITVPFPFFYGPLLYLYLAYSVRNENKIRKKDLLHFLPIVLIYIYMIRFYFFYSVEEKVMVANDTIEDFRIFINILVVGIMISAITYAIISYRLLNSYKALIENNFSNTRNINLNWLKGFIVGVALIFITAAVLIVSNEVIGIDFPFNPEYIIYSMLIIAVLCLGYFGIKHENVFTDNANIQSLADHTSYKKSSLKHETASEVHRALLNMMVEVKPYLEPNLTLSSLAERLDISLHHLSQVINQFEGQNFNDFINKYRVEEFIERAAADRHFSFLAIALDSGFNSKSTFNSVFKKHKGITPSRFMATYQNKH